MLNRFIVGALVALSALSACAQPQPVAPGLGSTAADLDLAGMDPAVAPGDDFFAYANGGWVKSHEIPADRGSYHNFAMLHEQTVERTAALIQEAAAKAPAGSEAQKIGDYYTS